MDSRAVGVEPTLSAESQHVYSCFDALLANLNGHAQPAVPYEDAVCPFFVTWTRCSDERLRGCIGSLEARSIVSGLPQYALSAARDRRFQPITIAEVPGLMCTVSLLCCYEEAASWQDWTVGTHGLIIAFTDPQSGVHRSATYLPEIAHREGWTQRATVESLVRKAGYTGAVSAALLSSLRVTRYQSSLLTRTYAHYLAARQGSESVVVEDAAPARNACCFREF